MTIKGQNFEVYQGDNKEIIITVREDDGSLTDLTGYVAVFCVYNQTLDNVVFYKTSTDGITIPNPTSGELHIILEQDDTDEVIPKVYGHQTEIEDGAGNHSTVTTGFVTVLKSMTHSLL